MRISRLGTAIASAALLAMSTAAPTPPPSAFPINSTNKSSPIPGQNGPSVAPPSGSPSSVVPSTISGPKRPSLEVNKYFREPGYDNKLSHYDKRYFHGIVSDEERTDTQSHMMRAYLSFFHEQDLDTWIAHGTLLGWWWNGKRLPWDFDIDTQVSGETLKHLGDVYNQTRYQYASEDGTTTREYLLDVNPWIWQRDRGDGMNVIDARWIDIRNGLFIDITGLSEVHPERSPGVWSCKNYHMYRTAELYPMRETMFEGVLAKVPYDYDKILVDEYRESALINTHFNGHRWDMNLKEWVKTQATLDREDRLREEAQKNQWLQAAETEKLRKAEEERMAKLKLAQEAKDDALKSSQEAKEQTAGNENRGNTEVLEKAKLV